MTNSMADSGINTLRKWLWNSWLRVPWLIAFNVGGAALLVGVFAFTSQGQALLRISAERGFRCNDWTLGSPIGAT